MSNNSKSLFDQIGIAGAGVILILVGIVLTSFHTPYWNSFYITLGVACLALAGAKETQGTFQLVIGIISAGFFLASVIILLVA